MSDLPDGWEWATLGELGNYINGRSFKKSEWSDNGRPIIRIQNLTNSSATWNYYPGAIEDCHLVRDGDLLISWAATIGSYIWHGPEAALNQHIFKTESYIDKHFHRHLVEHYLPEIHKNSHGSGMLHVTKTKFNSTAVPLPPLAEQRRIVAALERGLSRASTGDKQIDRVRQFLSCLRDHIRAAAACGQLEAKQPIKDSAQPPRPADIDDGTLPTVPENWTWHRLGDISDISGGITRDSKKQYVSSLPEVPYLRVANVQRGYLDLTEVARIRVPQKKVDALKLKHGDVLLNEGGDRDKLGRGWVWEGQVADCIHQNHVFRVRLHEGILEPKLLAWHANGFGRGWFSRNGKQSTNLASIKLSTLKQLPVPVPPVEEQESLVAIAEEQLTRLELSEHYRSSAQTRAEQLRSSLLREAFAGRLVPQDPNDEPASVLLERIRAERAQTSTGKRTSRAKKLAKTASKATAPPSPAQETPSPNTSEFDSSKPLPETPGRGTQDTLELDL